MKTTIWLAAGIALLAGCKKAEDSPGPAATTCSIVINDTLNIRPDSVRWDYYSGLARVQAFTGKDAVFTLWPPAVANGTYTLDRQRVFWMYKSAIYTPGSAAGSLVLSNSNDVLGGTFNAAGTVWSGTGPADSKIRVTFAGVRKVP